MRRCSTATSSGDGVDTDFYGTLSVIGALGPLTPSEVAERTGTPLTTVSDRLRRMVADGDVERVANPGDGRSHLVRLTAEGDARWQQRLAGAPDDDRRRSRTTSSGRSTRSRTRSRT